MLDRKGKKERKKGRNRGKDKINNRTYRQKEKDRREKEKGKREIKREKSGAMRIILFPAVLKLFPPPSPLSIVTKKDT